MKDLAAFSKLSASPTLLLGFIIIIFWFYFFQFKTLKDYLYWGGGGNTPEILGVGNYPQDSSGRVITPKILGGVITPNNPLCYASGYHSSFNCPVHQICCTDPPFRNTGLGHWVHQTCKKDRPVQELCCTVTFLYRPTSVGKAKTG